MCVSVINCRSFTLVIFTIALTICIACLSIPFRFVVGMYGHNMLSLNHNYTSAYNQNV